MTFQAFLESDACVRFGWTLLHSLWQLAIIGALAAITIACLRPRTHARYAVAYLALLLMAVAPVATYFVVTPPATPLEVAGVASETPPIALTPPEHRAQPVDPSIVEMEVDAARNSSPLSPTPQEKRELPSESETLALPPIEDVDFSPAPEPESTPTTERANEPAPPSLAQRAARASAWLAPFWLAGVVLLSLRHLGGWVLSRRLLCTAARLEHIELQRRLEGLIRKMGVRRSVRLLQSTLADAPMVLGVIRPALIAPVSLVTGLSPTQWEAILAHELAHIRRHDYLMNLVQIVIETLLFYHPAVWWLSRCIRAERENCCDDIAAEYCGSPVALAEGLAAIEAVRLTNGATSPAVAAVGPGSQDSTLRRVRRILGFSDANPKRGRTWLAGLLVLTLLAIAGVVGHRAGAQAEGNEDESNSQSELADDAGSRLLPLHTNGSIFLDMKSTAGGRNGVAQLPWIAFSKTEGVLHAELQTRLISIPKGKWLVTLDLLPNDDEHAEPLASADAIFENSGIVKGLPSTSTQFIRWHLGSDRLANQATHFRVTLSPSTKPGVRQTLPLLDGAPIPFLLESTPGGQGATATLAEIAFTTESGKLQADLLGSVTSWPKTGWRIVVELVSSDKNVQPVASGEATLINSGEIISKPGFESHELQLMLGDPSLLREATAVRVSLIPNAEQVSARSVDVEGRVLDAEDKPIEALLVVRTPDGRLLPTIASDSDGRFTIPSCPSTRVALLALARDGRFGPVAQMFDAREGMERLTLRLTAKRELRVRAADQFDKLVAPGGLRIGLPLVNATGEEEPHFWLSSPYDDLLADVLPETVLDASGRFAWDAAPDGPLSLQVSGANHGETKVSVPRDSDGQVDVVMKRPVARLIANARLESGGPPALTKIQLWPEVDHAIHLPRPGRGVIDIYENRPEYVYRITAEGYVPMTHKVLLKDVLETTYYPITTPDGNIEYRPSRRPIGDSDAVIAAAPIPSPWKARSIGGDGLRVAASFAPVCLTPNGKLAIDADVCVQGYGKFGNSFRKPIVSNGRADSAFGTDEQGRAIIPAYIAKAGMTDRPAGGIVILHDSGYKILTRSEFAAADRITLDPWGRITGQYTVDGEPREGQELSLTAEPSADETIRTLFRVKDHETPDAEGRFTFERLLPGTYHLAGPDETQTMEVTPGESVTLDFESKSRSPTQAYRVRRATTDRFLQAVFAKPDFREVAKVTDHFWPTDYLDISKSFSPRAGQFERVLSCRMCQAEGGRYMEARCKWEKAVMLVRLTFDEEGEEVTGFWLARDKEGPTPKGFKRGGYIIGRSMMEVAGLGKTDYSNLKNLALHAKLVDEDGQLLRPRVYTRLLKRRTTPDTSSDSIEEFNGERWTFISRMRGAEDAITGLSPGIYRLRSNFLEAEPTWSDPIRLDGAAPTVAYTFMIPDRERVSCRFEANLIDAESGNEITGFHPVYSIYRNTPTCMESDFPPTSIYTGEAFPFDCALVPGEYHVWITGAWHTVGDHLRVPAERPRFSFVVTEEGPNEFHFNVTSRRLSEGDAEVAKRWPCVVQGVVRDVNGSPVAGANVYIGERNVHINEKEPTRAARAWATTDNEGRYSLRFVYRNYASPIFAAREFRDGRAWANANVRVTIDKPGYVMTNPIERGRLWFVEKMPHDKNGEPLAPDVMTTPDRPLQGIDLTLALEESEPGETMTTDPEQESNETPHDERVRRVTTYKFLQALFTHQSMSEVRKLTGVSWPRSYIYIAKSFHQRAGPYERALSYRMVRTEGGDYVEARCKWKEAIMLVRVTFNATGELVTGFWLARDKQGPTPKGFKRGGYILGKPMMKIAGLDENAYSNIHNLSAHVTLVDQNGKPKDPPPRTMLWKRTLDPNAHAYSSADLIEDMDGGKWQYVGGMRAADHTFSGLSAGVYRLTADYLRTRTIVSDAFSVTGSPAQADVSFAIPDLQYTACRISARLIDKETNQPLDTFQPLFKLYRSGFPRVRNRYDSKDDNSTPYTCELLPGVYHVDVHGAWHSIGARSRALAQPTRFPFEVTEDGPNAFTFEIPSYSFAEDDAEVAKRWPDVVKGVVRTADGEPVEGADVHVHGRPEERAWTTTDADGRYSLRFAPRHYTTAHRAADLFRRGQLDVYVNATVHVDLPGFVEANLARQGRFTVVEETPLDKAGNPLAPEEIAVRGEPFHDINFTMVPAARIDTNFFRDQDGKPMDRRLILRNADDPDQRIYERDSPVDHFEGVPTVGRWRFRTYHVPGGPNFDSSLSSAMSFPTPGSYHAYLQAVEIPEEERSHSTRSLRLKLLSLIDPNGKEVAPSPEGHIMIDGKREPLPSPVRIGENSDEN